MEVEERFRAMGTDVHFIINGERSHATFAKKRLEDLENKWSRFLPFSEITQLNNALGQPFSVSSETALLIERACEGFHVTNGLYDPTILGDLIRLGYTQPYEQLDGSSGESEFVAGASHISIDHNVVTLSEGVGFDPGGIGKGLAADIIATELINKGALGALINIGGDACARGLAPQGIDWMISIEDHEGKTVDSVAINQGAIATSTTKKRTWLHDGDVVNHLIDPSTGQNAKSDVVLASVLSDQCWQAEVLTKALLIGDTLEGLKLVESLGAQAQVQMESGERAATSGWEQFRCNEVNQ